AVISAVAVAIASLVLNIIILTRVNNINNGGGNNDNNVTVPTSSPASTVPPPSPAPANDTKQAAAFLLNGLDQSVDPCEDFYAFTCNNFIAQVNLTALGRSRLGTYDQAQVDVNTLVAAALKDVDVNDDKKWSATERITKAALDACVINSNLEHSLDYSMQILADIKNWFGGVPFLNQPIKNNVDIFAAVGTIEQTHAVGTLLGSWVSVDYKNVAQNALYVSQPSLSMPRDFYTLPQFVDKLNSRAEQIEEVMKLFAADVTDDSTKYAATIKKASQDVANFEAQIAMASWPDEEMRRACYCIFDRNYEQQYNAYKMDTLKKAYPSIGWDSYLPNLLSSVEKAVDVVSDQADYYPIIAAYNKNKTDFYTILNMLKAGLENREAFRLLVAPDNKGDRSNFLQSPAMVNAWYQPERNSITFPYAIWNPPYYNLEFPQAYNYAGQGGTGGHELTHGFDDEGVQFGWDGSLTNCTWNQCGWMDTNSKTGFTDMAQCVVSQYSTQCCPEKTGNVHCANGATTQGENIADLGGQQAAYNAYRQYIKEQGHEELRLPGLAQFSPNQIFWITYGYSWCMKQNDANLVNQLLTNPHAPGSCRTNQVMQDIPSFGKDFGCRQGSPMYPKPDQRCKVWVGY
ncbi:peptidase family M13, partial [Ostertagia ostertagi]